MAQLDELLQKLTNKMATEGVYKKYLNYNLLRDVCFVLQCFLFLI